jgi:aryl-alcohol dehydrogenase-like predicted oxidoreductase
LARGSLAQGLLVNKPARAYLNRSEDEVKKASDLLEALAQDVAGKTALAVHYVLHHPAITTAVVGVREMGQLEQLLAISENMGEDKYQALATAVAPNLYQDHR